LGKEATPTNPDPPKVARPLACPVSNREHLLPAHINLSATAAPSGHEQTVSGAGRPVMGTLRVAQIAGISLALSPGERQQHELTLYRNIRIRHPIVEEVLHARSHG
jgi:CelD/BcsL family acetyltransferase involved in cellulose biosynthesis